jgi:hypothetical protein
LFAKSFIPLIIGGIIVLAACGGGSDEDNATQAEETAPAGNGSQQIGREEFGMTEEQLVATIDAVESSIADCMSEAGFEYIPIDAETFRDAMDLVGGSPPGFTDEEFVAQYGYGITTLPPKSEFRFGDENQRIFDDLSSEDQVAYTRTLVGDHETATFVLMLEQEDFLPAGGCTETAIEEVFTPEQLSPSFFNPFDALVEQDPRMIEAQENWSNCMKGAGFEYATQGDPEDEFVERLQTLTGGADPATLEGSDKEALEQLQGEERAIAAVDFECASEHIDDVEAQVEQDISGRN